MKECVCEQALRLLYSPSASSIAATVAGGSSTSMTSRAYRSSLSLITTVFSGLCTSQNTRSPSWWKVPAVMTPGMCVPPVLTPRHHPCVSCGSAWATHYVRERDLQAAPASPQLVHASYVDDQGVFGKLHFGHGA